MLATSPGAIRLGLCVPSEQNLLLETGAEVLTEGNDSRMIPIHELTPEQAQQVFVHGHVRTLAEQRSWLAKSAKKAPADFVGGYSVHKDFVVIKEPMRIPKKLILQFLVEMS